MSPQRHETRSGTIGRHIWRAIQAGQLTWEDLADRARKHYQTLLPERMQGIQWQDPERAPRPSVALASNGRKVSSWFDPERTARLPAEAEEAVVYSLPEPYHTECLRDLTERYGLHYAPQYEPGSAGTYTGLGELTSEFADVQKALADGSVDAADIAELKQLADAAYALIRRGQEKHLRRVS